MRMCDRDPPIDRSLGIFFRGRGVHGPEGGGSKQAWSIIIGNVEQTQLFLINSRGLVAQSHNMIRRDSVVDATGNFAHLGSLMCT